MSGPRRILIVRLGAIGDVVHALPLACRLRRGFPEARIDWAVGPVAAPLLEGHPAIDRTIILDKRAPLSFARRALAERAAPADVAIDLQGLFASGAAAFLMGAPRRLSFDRARTREASSIFHTERLAPAPRDGPIIEQNLAFADALGAPPAPLEFRLGAPAAARAEATALLAGANGSPIAALIVGAGKDANRPAERTLVEVASALARAGLAPVLLGGARDVEAAARIAGASGARDLAGRTGLAVTLALLERAAVAVGGDTGPLHAAAACGTPVVALFGGANPARTGPVGAGSPVRVIWRRWACAPCYARVCPIDRGCLESIGGEEVAAAALSIVRPPT